jgi:hypothetical protein
MGLVSPRSSFGVDVVLLCKTEDIASLCTLYPEELLKLVRSNADGVFVSIDSSTAFPFTFSAQASIEGSICADCGATKVTIGPIWARTNSMHSLLN